MGGGLRQAGILAAAGIIALTEQVSHLGEDHQRAKYIARKLTELPVNVKPETVEINMVFFDYPPAKENVAADRIMGIFKKHGIIINAPEQGLFRFVTHFWIGDTEAEAILAASREAFV
jgi:threonine aldolase